jgi:glutamate carboxypeptidase
MKLLGVFLFVVLATPVGHARAQSLSPVELALRDAVDRRADEALAFLERTVAINSGTFNLEGVRVVGAVYDAAFRELGMTTQWIGYPDSIGRAGHLVARSPGREGPGVLLLGHLDTVFEPASPFQALSRHGGDLVGPGVVDMKGGNAVILFGLKALFDAGALRDATITVMLTGDEEDPGEVDVVRRELIAEAKRAAAVLEFEGSAGPHHATIARRGVSRWQLVVEARTGHSSQIFTESLGYGAVYEVARILDAFRRALDSETYLTLNPGLAVAGTEAAFDKTGSIGEASGKTNVLASHAVVEGDMRFMTEDQKEMARSTMRNIVRQNLPGTRATITFRDRYPAMPPTAGNERLFRLFDTASRDLGFGGIQPIDPGARGAADISFAAPHADALAGLGPNGGGSHAEGEHMEIASLRIATQRAALLIYRLTRK